MSRNIIGIIAVLLGCMETCFSQEPVDCDNLLSGFLNCDASLATSILTAVTSAGGDNATFLTQTDLTDDQEAEFFYDIIADVFCRTLVSSDAGCFVDNALLCPEFGEHQNTTGKLLAGVFLEHNDTVANLSTACAFLERTRCSYKRARFDVCVTNIRDGLSNSALNIPLDLFCSPDSRGNTTCVLDTYKACPVAVLADNTLVPSITQTLMQEDQWTNFTDGNHFCECYEAKQCYDTITGEITVATENDNSDASRALHTSQTLCTKRSSIACADALRAGQCSHMTDYATIIGTVSNWQTTLENCDVISSNFEGNEDCVTTNSEPCFLTYGAFTCSTYSTVYSCIDGALKGKCGLEETNSSYINAAFDMYRALQGNIDLCPSVPVKECRENQTAFLPCDARLSTALTEAAQAAGNQPQTVLNDTDLAVNDNAVTFYKTMAEVLCRPTHTSDVACFVDNLFSCPSLALHSDTQARLLAAALLDHKAAVQASNSTCSFLQERYCYHIKRRFNSCVADLRGAVSQGESQIPISKFCAPTAIANSTCVLNTYQTCPKAVFQDNEVVVPRLTQTIMLVDRWDRFTDANQMCNCYNGDDCYDKLDDSITIAATLNPIRQLQDVYKQALAIAQTVCETASQDRITCATAAQMPVCSQILRPYNASVRIINNLRISTPTLSCTLIRSNFDGKGDCLLPYLVNEYTGCMYAANSPPVDSPDCSGLERMYRCLRLHLNGRCGWEFDDLSHVMAVYDMMRIYHRDLPACSGIKTSSATTPVSTAILVIMSILYTICPL